MTSEEVVEQDNEDRIKAYSPPKTSTLAFKIFDFLRENDNLATVEGGMQTYKTGLHRPNLIESAKAYAIDLSKYMSIVLEYESEMLNKQRREHEAK